MILVRVLVLCAFTISFLFGNCDLRFLKSDLKEAEFKRFFNEYSNQLRKKFLLDCVSFIKIDENELVDRLIDWFLEEHQNLLRIILNMMNYDENSLIEDKLINTQLVFVFIETLQKLSKSLQDLEKHRFWSSKARIFFVITTELSKNNSNSLDKHLGTIWNMNVWNFAIVYFSTRFEVVTYNHFNSRHREIITKSIQNYTFPNKLLNMNQHKLKVGMFEDPPLTYKIKDEWKGNDYFLMRFIETMMNASVEIVETPKKDYYYGLHNLTEEGKVEFCMIRMFKVGNLSGVDETYPIVQENYVVLVPKAELIPQSAYIFMVFDSVIWLNIGVCLILITGIIACADRLVLRDQRLRKLAKIEENDLSKSFLYVWAILLSGNLKNFNILRNLKRVLLLVWIGTSMIFNTMFGCSLTSTLTTPKYLREIDSIGDLKESGLKIVVEKAVLRVLPREYNLESQLVPLQIDNQMKIDYAVHNRSALMASHSRAELLADMHGWHIMRDSLIPGHYVYYLRKNSPFGDELHRCMLWDRELGFSQRAEAWSSRKKSERTRFQEDTGLLKLFHLQGVFLYLWFSGLSLGIVCFVGEIFWFYRLRILGEFSSDRLFM